MNKGWAGVDAGKEFHWAYVLDASGSELLSRKVENDEADLLKPIDDALLLAEEVVWAVDQPGGGAALLLALLWEQNQRVLYVPGLTVDRARDTYRGESKTDARDAHLIADQSRMRSDLSEVPAAHESGKRVGSHRRMRGGNKILKRVFYQSAFASLRSAPDSRVFYDRKRSEGKRHTQALIALARRRVNVLWAMLRDGTTFESRSVA
jgi:transposase